MKAYETNIDENFSRYLNSKDFEGKLTQDDLVQQNAHHLWF